MLTRVLSKWYVYAGIALIALLTFAAYSDAPNQQALDWDDNTYIFNNPHIKNINTDNLYWMFTNFHLANWHPLTWLSLAANFSIWGNNPLSFKMLNICIHLLNAILLYLLTVKIMLSLKKSSRLHEPFISNPSRIHMAGLVAAAFFAISPQHVESVIWISERKDVLCAMFYLCAIYSYLLQNEQPNNSVWKNLTLIFFVLALMSKPMAVTLPLVLLLLDIHPLNRLNSDQKIKSFINLAASKWVFFTLSILVAIITIITQKTEIHGYEQYGILARVINSCSSILHYMWTTVYSFELSPYYPTRHWVSNISFFSFIPIIIVVYVFYSCIYYWRKTIRFPLIAWLFMLVTLLPVIDIVKVGATASADRYSYIPTMLIFVSMGIGIIILLSRSSSFKIILPIAVGALLLTQTITTYNYSKIWRSDFDLWQTVSKRHKSSVAHNNLAAIYIKQGDDEKSKHHIEKALKIAPTDMVSLKNMAIFYEMNKQTELAEKYYLKMVQANMGDVKALSIAGDFFLGNGRADKANEYYSKAMHLFPDSPDILARNAYILYLKKDYISAEKILNLANSIDKNNLTVLQVLAQLHVHKGDTQKAIITANRILSQNPSHPFASSLVDHLKSNGQLSP